MITRSHGDIEFHCEECDDVYETHESEFQEANRMAKDEGWRARQIAGEWCNFCSSECEHQYKKANA